MGLSSLTCRNGYVGTALLATYDYTFKIFQDSELYVAVMSAANPPVVTPLTLTTDYTVTGAGNASGGTIVLVSAGQAWLTAGKLAAGYRLIIRRKLPLTQIADIENQGSFFPENHEIEFDKLVMADQQQQDELDRSLKLPETLTTADFDPTLPTDINTPSKLLVTNPAGTGFSSVADSPASAIAAAASAAAAAASAASAAATTAPVFTDVIFITHADSPYTVTEGLHRGKIISCDTSGGNIAITLPQISTLTQLGTVPWVLGIKKTDALGTVSISRSGADTIDESAFDKELIFKDIATILIPSAGSAKWTAFDNLPNRSFSLSTKGDLLTYDTEPVRFPAGTDGQVLVAEAAQTVGIKWANALELTRNFLVNGDNDFCQRIAIDNGVATAVAASIFKMDRWRYRLAGSSAQVAFWHQSAVVPTLAESGWQSKHAVQIDVTTADAAAAAGDLVVYEQYIEGPVYSQLKGKTVTFSFWIRSGKTGVFNAFFQNNGRDRSYVVPFTINAADTWEKKTATVTLDQAGGTEDYRQGNTGLRVGICLMGGATFQTTTGAWRNGDFNCTAAQVTGLDNTATDIFLSQLCLNLGSVALPTFTRYSPTMAGEFAECAKFYQKTYDLADAPATATFAGAVEFIANGTAHRQHCAFPVRMAKAPSVTLYNPSTGAVAEARDTSAAVSIAAAVNDAGETGFTAAMVSSVDGNITSFHWAANAELT